jgi:hypothetical protein
MVEAWMDTRAIIMGGLAALATICGTILAAMQASQELAVACYGLASTCAGYAVGLYSEPVERISSSASIEASEGDDASA